MAFEDLTPELVARAVAGDRDALEAALRAVEPMIAGVSIQPVWSRDLEAADIYQVSCLEAFLRIHALREPTPAAFLTWFRRIVDNNLRDAIRALERGKRPSARDRVTRGAGGESARTLFAGMMGSGAGPATAAELGSEIERMHGCIRQLPKSYRLVIEEVDLAQRTVAEVAEEWGRSRGAVHLLRSRAHDRLRELLRGD